MTDGRPREALPEAWDHPGTLCLGVLRVPKGARMAGAHNYYVDLSQKLWDLKQALLKERQ